MDTDPLSEGYYDRIVIVRRSIVGALDRAPGEEEREYLADLCASVERHLKEIQLPQESLKRWTQSRLENPEVYRQNQIGMRREELFVDWYERAKFDVGSPTYREMSAMTGVHRNTFLAIEKARVMPRRGTIRKIADGFGVDLPSFMKGESREVENSHV